jgi:uncharacterized tellurite resistance protein B-like protein
MRSYPRNSPEAATRIVALALLADGHLCPREMALLNRLSVASQLGLPPANLQTVVRDFCEDLQQVERFSWAGVGHLSDETLRQLLAEIDEPALRLHLLRLCVHLVEADGQVTESESVVLCTAVDQWGLHRQMLVQPMSWPQAA